MDRDVYDLKTMNRRLLKKVEALEKKLEILESLPQLTDNATNSDIILIVNKITNSLKRKR